MIKDPCEKCAEAYGHKGICPTIILDADDKIEAEANWQRGYNAAAANVEASTEDEGNEHYMLGRKHHELESSGRLPKRRKRVIRVPAKSEPRMAAVTTARAGS